MNNKSLRVLEWQKVQELVASQASFSLGRARVKALAPSTDLNQVRERLALTTDAVRLLNEHGEAPFGGAGDIKKAVGKARLGGILETDQLLSLADFLYCTMQLKKYFACETGPVAELGNSLLSAKMLQDEIERCIHPDGHVRDRASAELSRLRNRIRTLSGRIRDRLDALLHSPGMQKILQDPIVTVRSGRYVVPVRSEYRNRFQGIVHDQSGSGATLFMEPSFSVELNNDLNVAEQEEEAEIQRILKRLSGLVGEKASDLLTNVEIVTELDSIFARARYSRQIDGVEPQMNAVGKINIKQGRHPLLKGDVVPIDIWLGDNFHVLVITGPNTGGKTVTLKTVGLFSLMAQAGLHIPADLGSELAVFEGIYADIGDEQSIEQSLSTFSSHMTTIVEVLDVLEQNSLVLLDELGAGTDPTEGAALATAILEYLRRRSICTIATTHYSALKSYAYSHEGVENASVEFDLETLRPTFRLAVGIPGKSNAFAISRRLGLRGEIVEKAQSLLSSDHIRVEDIIGEMESNRRLAERERLSGERFRAEYAELKAKYEKLLADLEENRNKIMDTARQEAQSIIAETQAELNQILGQARRQGQAELEVDVKTYRQELALRQAKLESQQKEKPKPAGPANLKQGEEVRIKSLRQTGFVLEPPTAGGEVQVQAGIMKISVAAADLERISGQPASTPARGKGSVSRAHLAKSSSIRSEIDLRGKTVEEGVALVDKYLDDAFLSSLARVRIIHGKGTGVLGEAIQRYLNSHPHVREIRYGAPNEGGHGVTVVELHLPG
ncbi:MAG TPA: endonuclease MutS2 [Firmicutes bacterium]|nr:endonuclease MutS2 [Bacillota bacterium]